MIRVNAVGYVIGDKRVTETEKGCFVNFAISCKSEKPKADMKDTQLWDAEIFCREGSKLPDFIKKGTQVAISGAGLYYNEGEKDGTKRRYYKLRIKSPMDLRLVGGGQSKGSSEKPESSKEASEKSDDGKGDWDV